MVEELREALALMRSALEVLDGCHDPVDAGPYLDLAIARIEKGINATAGNDNLTGSHRRARDSD